MTDTKKQLNEIRMSWAGQIFFAGVAAYLAGKAYKAVKKLNNEDIGDNTSDTGTKIPSIPIKVKGTPEQIQAITNAIVTSKEYQDEITREGATIEGVLEKLKQRNMAKNDFLKRTGKIWPL
jgi:hypothetical protein